MKDLVKVKYYLGIEVLRSKIGMILNQRDYVLELNFVMGLTRAKPVNTPLESNSRLTTMECDNVVCHT